MSESEVVSKGTRYFLENLAVSRLIVLEETDNDCLLVLRDLLPLGSGVDSGRGRARLLAHVSGDAVYFIRLEVTSLKVVVHSR